MIDNTPLVSVVMSCYNSETYLRETIESVLAQTYFNFEFFIQNDSSTDNTEKIIKSYNDPRIHYILHERSYLSEALNNMCSLAKGKYIARIDGDDICMPERFAEQVSYLESHEDCVLVSSDAWFIDENGVVIDRYFPYSKASIIKKLLDHGICTINHPASMFRKKVFDEVGGYVPSKYFEDMLLWQKFKEVGKLVCLQKPLIKYRVLANSLSHAEDRGEYVDVLKAIKEKIIRDRGQNSSDLQLFYDIYSLNKSSVKDIGINDEYRCEPSYKLFKALRIVLGDDISENLVYFLRNIQGYYKVSRL